MGRLRVATFNIQHGRLPSGPVDTVATARACASLDVDVLAIHEVDRWKARSHFSHQARSVARATGMACVFSAALRSWWWFGAYGDALLVRGRLTTVERVALPHERGHEPRTAIIADVRVRDAGLTVASTHLSVATRESEPQLLAVLAALSRRPRPWVLLGDLNLWPDRVEPAVTAAGLTLVDPSAPTFPVDAPRARIDHCAVAGLDVGSVEARALPASDHCALVVELGN
jgi:endonuclease/exonuclease/phosphatase family metal-dependent hydrolase